jgi:hypothetical protein
MRSRRSLTQDGHGLFTLSKWRSFLAPRIEGQLPLQSGPIPEKALPPFHFFRTLV